MDRETYLLHQVHPAKLAADISASIISTGLFWRGRYLEAVVSASALPVVASALVTRADCSWLKDTAMGRYVLAHMPPWAQTVRLGGAALMAYGGWKRRPGLIAVSLLIVAAGWCDGLFAAVRSSIPLGYKQGHQDVLAGEFEGPP